MSFARVVLASVVVIVLLGAVSADGGQKEPSGTLSNPLVALPNPTPTRVPPSTEPETNQAPRRADGTQLGDPSRSQSSETQRGSTALHDGKPVVAQPPTPRRQKAQPPSTRRPCSLVSRAEAREIIGAPIVAPLEAPQGPTCIYRTESSAAYVTITSQDAGIDQLRRRLDAGRSVTVAGRTGYCGTAGGPALYVALSERRTLTVAAPCEMAQRLAALAIGRL